MLGDTADRRGRAPASRPLWAPGPSSVMLWEPGPGPAAAGDLAWWQSPKVSAKHLTVLQFSTLSTGQLQTCIQRGHFYSSS